jgi:hypothetical protein
LLSLYGRVPDLAMRRNSRALGRSRLEGQRARIEYHESQRGQYTNVYLDKVEPAPSEPGGGGDDTHPHEAAWRTAVEAAPRLVGESEPHEEVPPEELYDKLKPFKERVAEDIKEERDRGRRGRRAS